MKYALLLLLSAQAFGAGLASYAHLVASDFPDAARNGVRVTYLGTNGYQFEFKGHLLLVDPYFSRVNFWSVASGSLIQPNVSRVIEGLKHIASHVDAILVTHSHFDHLLDVPVIMSKRHARLIASKSSIKLVRNVGAPGGDAVAPGDPRRLGPFKIRALRATHDRLFRNVPFDQRNLPCTGPPRRASDWICGQPLAFLIEAGGQRIYIDSGGTPAQLLPDERVDLAILGMASPDSRARLPGALERLRPSYLLPKSPG